MVIPIPHTVLHYTEDDVDLFGQWLDSLTYLIAQAVIAARLVRLELGLATAMRWRVACLNCALNTGRVDACTTASSPGAWCCCWQAAINLVKKAPSKRHANV